MARLERQIRMKATISTSGANATNFFVHQQQQASGGMDGSLDQEQQVHITIEQEVGKLTLTNIITVSGNGRHGHGQPIISTLLILIYPANDYGNIGHGEEHQMVKNLSSFTYTHFE